jgi:Protein of unknown function (DUF1552)
MKIGKSNPLPRRTVLRGLVHGVPAWVGLPLLETMMDSRGEALAATGGRKGKPVPRRLGIFFWGNGVKLDRWTPQTLGPAYALSPELAPFEKLKSYVSVVSGMRIYTGEERGHHAGTVGLLSGSPMLPQSHPTSGYASTFSAPSIDQVAASVIGKTTPFQSIEVGVSKRVVDGEGSTLQYLSHRGPDNACPPDYDPRMIFDRLFGQGGAPGAAGQRGESALAAGRRMGHSVLDVVAEDLADLRANISGQDGHRLEQHLQNVREVESRLVIPPARRPGCKAPLKIGNPFAEVDGKEPMEAINDAMADLLAHALTCDLSRVFSVMFSGSVGHTVYWQLGHKESHHSLTHDEPGDQPQVHATTIFIMKQFARLLEVFKNTPDGAGNLLDNVAILGTTDLNEGKSHKNFDYPILVAGRAGGRLRPGLHYRSTTQENTSKVLLTLLRSVGLPLQAFGQKGGRVTESLTALES